MIKLEAKIGDLVMIPANVSLFRETEQGISSVESTDKPNYAILLKREKQIKSGGLFKTNNHIDVSQRCLIFLNGDYFTVHPEDIYEVFKELC